MAIPNAVLTFFVSTMLQSKDPDKFNEDGTSKASENKNLSDAATSVITAFSLIMIFILYNRSRISYNRWWEGGTLLQKTRGEWFNAYSSIMAFTSTKPEHKDMVEAYQHLLARLMSLLMCCGLQQVSPNRDRPFEIIDLVGIEPESMEFLNAAPDKVEVILQWIQRSMVLHVHTGILPVAPPILSRAFQEVSRGIVNLQNARKIADFPYPFPLAQVCMILQLLHWAMVPIAASLALPRGWAALLAFVTIFVIWCIHFNALDLEFPFGTRINDLPMNEMQQEWNNSILTLLDKRATRPPMFKYDPVLHDALDIVMSDASDLYIPKVPLPLYKGVAVIKVSDKKNKNKRRPSRNMTPPPGEIVRTCPSNDVARPETDTSEVCIVPRELDTGEVCIEASSGILEREKGSEFPSHGARVTLVASGAISASESTATIGAPECTVILTDDTAVAIGASPEPILGSTSEAPTNPSSQVSRDRCGGESIAKTPLPMDPPVDAPNPIPL